MMGRGALLVLAAGLLGCRPAPVCWSPDGQWLAYASVARAVDGTLAPGWLFDLAPREPDAADRDLLRRVDPAAYQVWVSAADGSASYLIEEGPLPVSAPAWNHDGTALAFGRLRPSAPGRVEYEVVVQEGPERRRVLARWPVAAWRPEFEGLPMAEPAWSPDGRYLAVPRPDPSGLAVLRADNGRMLKAIDDACLPSWSPDGSKLAFVRQDEPEGLYCLDTAFGAPRLLLEVGPVGQAAAWTADGQGLIAIRSRALDGPGGVPLRAAELVWVRAETGQVDRARPLVGQGFGLEQPISEVAFAVDGEGENLFFTAGAEGHGTLLVWGLAREGSTLKRFFPLGMPMTAGPLALSPGGTTLALRIGPPALLAPPALCDPRTEAVTPLVPDDPARVQWVRILVAAARKALDGHDAANRPAGFGGRPPERPTLLPVPGEIAANSELSFRLRRIGRIGRPLCDRPADAPPAAEAVEAILAEARLFFDYLRGDYPAALATLEALECRTESGDRRLRLLGLRAQIELARGEPDRARHAIDYLKELGPTRSSRVERAGERYMLTPAPGPNARWPEFLEAQASAFRADSEPETDHNPFGHFNPDAPLPGLGLDPDDRQRLPAILRPELPDRPFEVEIRVEEGPVLRPR